MTSVYDALVTDYPKLIEAIRNSEARGNASHSEPFRPERLATWCPDLAQEYADGMVYARAEQVLLDERKRNDPKARHRWLTLRIHERRLATMLAELKALDEPWL